MPSQSKSETCSDIELRRNACESIKSMGVESGYIHTNSPISYILFVKGVVDTIPIPCEQLGYTNPNDRLVRNEEQSLDVVVQAFDTSYYIQHKRRFLNVRNDF